MRTIRQIEVDARNKPAFSNATEADACMGNWCDRCLRDAPFRNMGTGSGCPILAVAVLGEQTPAEWFEQPWGEHGPSLYDRYHCVEFRAPGGGGAGEPRPRPEPRQDGLFDRPQRGTRMYVQPEHGEVRADA